MPAHMVPTLPMLDMPDTHTAMVPTHTTTAMLDTPMLPQSPMLLPQSHRNRPGQPICFPNHR